MNETLILPSGMRANPVAAAAIQMEGQAGADARARLAEEGMKATQLPKPAGYRILVAIPKAEEKFGNGLLKADMTKQVEEVTTVVGFVLAMGPDCYLDKAKFPTGPWCKVGDFIVFRAYSGTRLMIHSVEHRIVNDDTVEAIVLDPRGITRV